MLVNTLQDVTSVPYTSQHNTDPNTGFNTATSTDALLEGVTLHVSLPSQKYTVQGENGSLNLNDSSNVTNKNINLNTETDSCNTLQDVTSQDVTNQLPESIKTTSKLIYTI